VNRLLQRSIHTLVLLTIIGLHGCAPSVYDAYYRALDEGKADEVIARLADSLAADPSQVEAKKILAIAWFQKNNFIAADTLLSQYLQHEPDDDQAMYYCAAAADSLNDDAKALTWYRAYVTAAPQAALRAQADARIRQLVQRRMQQEVHRALFYEAALSASPKADSNSIAVLAFDNNGADRTLDPLGRGLAEMMTTDLSKVRAMKVVERLRMQTILDELSLCGSNPSSQQTAPRAGRLAGAQRIIKGTFVATDDGMMHLDAAAARTSTAEVDAYVSSLEPKENIFRAEKKLVFDLLRSLSIPVSENEREAILTVPTENYFAFVRYAQGLECADRGLYAQASAFFRQAIELDPHFTQAQDQLDYTDALSGDHAHAGTHANLPAIGGNTLVPQTPATDADAITSAGARAASSFTQTTGGFIPAPGDPVKTNPILVQHALPAPPPPRK
jgi:TolB-like protein